MAAQTVDGDGLWRGELGEIGIRHGVVILQTARQTAS
jgi:hypothetical protein